MNKEKQKKAERLANIIVWIAILLPSIILAISIFFIVFLVCNSSEIWEFMLQGIRDVAEASKGS